MRAIMLIIVSYATVLICSGVAVGQSTGVATVCEKDRVANADSGVGVGVPILKTPPSTGPSTPSGPSIPGTGTDGVGSNGELKSGPVTSGGPTTGGSGSTTPDPTSPTTVTDNTATGGGLTIQGPSTGGGNPGPTVTIPTSPAAPAPPGPAQPAPGPASGSGGAPNGGGPNGGNGGGGGGAGGPQCKADQDDCGYEDPNSIPPGLIKGCPEGQHCSPECKCIKTPVPAGPTTPTTGESVPKALSPSGTITETKLNSAELPSEMMAQWTSLSSGSSTRVAGSSPASSTLLDRQGCAGGVWFFTYGYPVMLWNACPTQGQLIAYFTNGNRAIFTQQSSGQYWLTSTEDRYRNSTDYIYANGKLSEIRKAGVITTFIWSGLTLTATRQACNLSYQNCQAIAGAETMTYDSHGRLLTHTGYDSSFVPDPTNPFAPYDVSSPITNPITESYIYNASGLLTEKRILRSTGEQETVFRVTYANSGGLWKVQTITTPHGASGDYVRTFSYQPTGSGTVVTVDDGTTSLEYTFDYYDHVTQLVARPLQNQAATPNMPEQRWVAEYVTPTYSDCSLVSKMTYPTGATWEGGYDTLYRLWAEAFTAPNNDNQLVATYREYGALYEGSPLLSYTDEKGVVTPIYYTYGTPQPNDAGFPITSMRVVQTATLTDGTTQTLADKVTFNARGDVLTEVTSSGVVTEYSYEPPNTGTLRELVLSAVSGPNDGSGHVDTASPDTTYARVERNAPSGTIKAMYEGPATNETKVEFSYDSLGRIVQSKSEAYMTNIFYSWQGELASVQRWSRDYKGGKNQDPAGRPTGADWYRTDYKISNGLLRAVLSDELRAPFATGGITATKYEYFPDGSLSKVEGPAGVALRYLYNGFGGVWKKILDDGTQKLLSETTESLTDTTVRSLVGESTQLDYADATYNYSKAGTLTSVSYPNGASVKLLYDELGNIIRTKGYHGTTLVSEMSGEVDELGRYIRGYIKNPITGTQTKLTEVLFGNAGPSKVYDQFQRATEYFYDGVGRVKKVTAKGGSTYYGYVPNRGEVYQVGVESEPGKTIFTRYGYDANSRVTSVSLVGDGTSPPITTQYRYDTLGNVGAVITPDGRNFEQSVSPDGFGWWRRIGGGAKSTGVTTPSRLPKILGTAQRTIDPVTHKTSIELKDEAGRVTKLVSGVAGLETSQLPGEAVTTIQYNGALKAKAIVSPEVLTQIYYDNLGRANKVTAQKGSAPLLTRELFRDTQDRIYRITDGSTQLEYLFDDYSAIKSEILTAPGFGPRQTDYSHDFNGVYDFSKYHSVQDVFNNITQTRDYDPVTDLVTGINVQTGTAALPVATFGYNGRVPSTITQSNGLTTQVNYDAYGLLKDHTTVNTTAAVTDRTEITRDSLLRIKELRRVGYPQGSKAFKYDSYGRLSGRKEGVTQFGTDYQSTVATKETRYTFDPKSLGLRNKVDVVTSSGTQTNTFDVDQVFGRYSAVNGNPIHYDGNGNVIDAAGKVYSFDGFGRLADVRDSNNNILASFTYDPQGRLIVVTNSHGSELQRWTGSSIFTKEDSTGLKGFNVWYPYVAKERLAYFKKTGTGFVDNYQTYSSLSPSKTFEGATEKEAYAYDFDGKRTVYVNGTPQNNSVAGNELGFHGMWLVDDTDVYYDLARFYNQNLGIFLSRDPLNPTDYTYAGTDNVNQWDPSGEQPVSLMPANWETMSGAELKAYWDHVQSVKDRWGAQSCMICHDAVIQYYCPGLPLGRELIEGSADLRFIEQFFGKLIFGAAMGLSLPALPAEVAISVGAYGACCLGEDIYKNGPTASNMSDVAALAASLGIAAGCGNPATKTGVAVVGKPSTGVTTKPPPATGGLRGKLGREASPPPATDTGNTLAKAAGCNDCNFSQTSVSIKFSEEFTRRLNRPDLFKIGSRVRLTDVAKAIATGKLKLSELPEITVVRLPDGSLLTFNNRGLAIIKWARNQGVEGSVNVKVIPWNECPKDMMDELQGMLSRNNLGASGSKSVKVGITNPSGVFQESPTLYTSPAGIH